MRIELALYDEGTSGKPFAHYIAKSNSKWLYMSWQHFPGTVELPLTVKAL
jgi:hypothetical protein